MTKEITQKLEKVEYTHLETWIDNIQGIESITKCALRQQFIVREQEIAELKDKLHVKDATILELGIKNDVLKDKLHRRNMQIKDLETKLSNVTQKYNDLVMQHNLGLKEIDPNSFYGDDEANR